MAMKRLPAFLIALVLVCCGIVAPISPTGQLAQAQAANFSPTTSQPAGSATTQAVDVDTPQLAASDAPQLAAASTPQLVAASTTRLLSAQSCLCSAQQPYLSAAKTTFKFKNGAEQSVYKGKSKKLTVKKSVPAKLTWHSSNKKIATVTQKGVVKGKRNGFVTITAENPKTGEFHDCYVRVYEKRTQAQARKIILGLKSKAKYREGKPWTNENTYFWDAANAYCAGCIAFAGIASDKAFGKYAPLKAHSNFNKIKVGDHIRIGGYHSVVVLYKKADSVTVVEGNYNNSIHWGREITRAELKDEGFEVWTRY